MKIPLALLADYANVSQDGKLNIMGIFDTIYTISGFPCTHAQMRIIFKLQFSPAEQGTTKNIQVKLLDADGHNLLALSSTFQVPENVPANQEFPQILELNGLTFPNEGEYAFSILVNEEERVSIPLKVLPFSMQLEKP